MGAIMAGPFKEQRAAYRRCHGGSGAPELSLQIKPKLLGTRSDSLNESDGHWQATVDLLPIQSTFVHFGLGSSLSVPKRSGSCPCLESINNKWEGKEAGGWASGKTSSSESSS